MTPSPGPVHHADPARPLGDIVLRRVRGHHAFESCVEQLATTIRLGAFSFGAVLPPERELAERMGVSRATVREAIAGLRSAGMVRTKRGRGGGTMVAYRPPAPGEAPSIAERHDELLDSLVFRRVVEPGACFLAAGRELSASERMLLTTTLAEVDQATDPGDHRQADSRLHLAIASVSGSPKTVEAVTGVQADLHDMLQAIPVLGVNIEHSNRQHRAIVNAIVGGEPTKARRAMEQHCDDTAALLRGLLG